MPKKERERRISELTKREVNCLEVLSKSPLKFHQIFSAIEYEITPPELLSSLENLRQQNYVFLNRQEKYKITESGIEKLRSQGETLL